MNKNITRVFFWIQIVFACIVLYLVTGLFMKLADGSLIGYLTDEDAIKLLAAGLKSPLVFELFAGILGTILTVAALALMFNMQSRQETHKEFSTKLFTTKLEIYRSLLDDIFCADDDTKMTEVEVHAIENKIGLACLVANEELVSIFAQFLIQVKLYGVPYYRKMDKEQIGLFAELVQDDKKKSSVESILSRSNQRMSKPVEDHTHEYFVTLDNVIQGMREDLAVVEGNVQQEIEHFVRTPFYPGGRGKLPKLDQQEA